ncbi:MAG: hypothetical protein LUQ50_10530 [Methanospirillum sp.]|uniref:hypothetical protein n=1 Tax=Methanospirillum sp. TaxID=45200 RepID=UPI002373D82E|nr:hypothetical protein [Methanospirillum sp.]MDD1729492.1 hypothetical protein [Methanospirillum sp.]
MMKKTALGVVGITLVAVVIIMMVILPVSGAGKTGPQDGTGNQFGGTAYQMGGNGNGTCIQGTCLHTGTRPCNEAGMQCGRSGNKYGNGGHAVHHDQRNAQQNRA